MMFLLPSPSRNESESSLFIVLLELERTNILFNEIAFKISFFVYVASYLKQSL